MPSTVGPFTAPPAVVHLVPSAVGRGAQHFARGLVDALGGPAGGHQLVTLFDGEADVPVEATVGAPGGASATRGLSPGVGVALRRWLRRTRPDLVVAHGGNVLKYAALTSPVPVIGHAVGIMPDVACHGARRQLWRAVTARASVVVAVSDDVADQARTVLGVDGRRLVVVPNGRDPDRFRPAEPAADPADPTPRRRGGAAGGGEVTLLFVGRLTAGKRPDRFVALVSELRRRGLAVRGTMVGDGPLRPALVGPAAAAGVEMVGHCADVVPYFQDADVFVFPSHPDGEGMPGVLIEAGLCGLPVVTTAVPGASTVVVDGHTGLVVPVDDAGGLAAAVGALVTDPVRRVAMGAAAREHCREELAMARSVERWRQLLSGGGDGQTGRATLPGHGGGSTPVGSPPVGSPPRIAAVVVTHNAPRTLDRCLEAIAGQTMAPAAVLVVDNASSPPVDAARLPAGLPPVTVVRAEVNGGPAGGYAVALEHLLGTDASHAWVLDDDVRPEPGCLAALWSVGAAAAERAFVFPRAVQPDGRVGVWPSWCGVLIARPIIEAVGVPLAELFWWAEDTEYLRWRIPRAGYPRRTAADALVHHDAVRHTRAVPTWKYYYEARNMLYFHLHVMRRVGRYPRNIGGLVGRAVLREPSGRLRRLAAIGRGLVDGALGRLGQRYPVTALAEQVGGQGSDR